MYYLMVLVLLFVAELFILRLLINAILLTSRMNGVPIQESLYAAAASSSISVRWPTF